MTKKWAGVFTALLVLGSFCSVMASQWTPHGFFYKPGLGARGTIEKNTYDSGLDLVDARLSKEIWVGDPNYGTTIQAAISAIGGNQVILRLPAGTHSITADLTIPANITIKPERGAILSIATTKTLTLNGGVKAGLYQIFSSAGTGKVVFGPRAVDRIWPQWWGAKGDNSTDDTAALQACFDAQATPTAYSGRPEVALIGKYKTTATLNIKNNNDLHIKGYGGGYNGASINGVGISGAVVNWGGSSYFVAEDVAFTADASTSALFYFYRTTASQGGGWKFIRCLISGPVTQVLMYAIGQEDIEFRSCKVVPQSNVIGYLCTNSDSLNLAFSDLDTDYTYGHYSTNAVALFDGGEWWQGYGGATAAAAVMKFEGGNTYDIRNVSFANAVGSLSSCIWIGNSGGQTVWGINITGCRQEGATGSPFLRITSMTGGLTYQNNTINSSTEAIHVDNSTSLNYSTIIGNGGGNSTTYRFGLLYKCNILDPTFDITMNGADGIINNSVVQVKSITYNDGSYCYVSVIRETNVSGNSMVFDLSPLSPGYGVNYPGINIRNNNNYGAFINFDEKSWDFAKIRGWYNGSANVLSFYLGTTESFQMLASGDIKLLTAGKGIIVTSPNGSITKRIGIDNSGNIVATTP